MHHIFYFFYHNKNYLIFYNYKLFFINPAIEEKLSSLVITFIFCPFFINIFTTNAINLLNIPFPKILGLYHPTKHSLLFSATIIN